MIYLLWALGSDAFSKRFLTIFSNSHVEKVIIIHVIDVDLMLVDTRYNL